MFRNPCHRLKMKSEWGSRRNLRCWPEIVPRLCVARAKERQVTRVLKCSCRLFSIINSKSDPRFRPLFYFRGNCCYALNSNPSRCPYHGGTSTTMATNRRCTCHQTHNAKWQKGEGPKIQHKKKCWWRSSAYLSLVFIFFVLPVSSTPLSQTHTPHSADYEIKIVSVSVVVDPRNRCVFEYILQRWLVIPFAHIQGVSQVHLKKPPWQIDNETPHRILMII